MSRPTASGRGPISNPNANTLTDEPAHPGRTGSTTITMQYVAGCPFTESVTPRSSNERQKMYTELLVGAAQIAGLMVNGQSANDLLALLNSLTGPYAYPHARRSGRT